LEVLLRVYSPQTLLRIRTSSGHLPLVPTIPPPGLRCPPKRNCSSNLKNRHWRPLSQREIGSPERKEDVISIDPSGLYPQNIEDASRGILTHVHGLTVQTAPKNPEVGTGEPRPLSGVRGAYTASSNVERRSPPVSTLGGLRPSGI